jgi:hypothetical protein
VEVEPAENVLIGALTSVGPATINRVPVDLLPANEPRLPADPVMNEFGIPVILNAVVLDKLAVSNGYYDGARFRAYHLEVDASADLVSNAPQIAVTRALFREQDPANQEGDGFEIRGGVTFMHAPGGVTQQQIEVFRLDGGAATSLGTTVALRDPEFPRFGKWRLRGDTPLTNDPILGRSPLRVRAVNLSIGANSVAAEADTDIR